MAEWMDTALGIVATLTLKPNGLFGKKVVVRV